MLTRILHRTFTLTCITLLPFLSNPSQKLLKYKYIIRAQSSAPLKVLSTRDFFALAVGRRKTTLFTKIPYLSKNTRTYTLHSLYRISHASFKYVIYLGSPYNKIHFHVKKIEFRHSNNKASIIQHTTQKTNALFCTKSVRLLTNQNFSAKYDTTFTKTYAVGL